MSNDMGIDMANVKPFMGEIWDNFLCGLCVIWTGISKNGQCQNVWKKHKSMSLDLDLCTLWIIS